VSGPAFALTPDMREAIGHPLSALAPRPQDGYLAGQAVSSAVFELFVPGGEGLPERPFREFA
jgi:hypothetical protein